MDFQNLIPDMLTSARAAAKGHAADLKNYLQARTRLIAEGTVAIARDVLDEEITLDDAKFAFDEIRASEKTAVLAVKATSRAAAQDAINAAIAVASAALSKAVGAVL